MRFNSILLRSIDIGITSGKKFDGIRSGGIESVDLLSQKEK